MPLLIYVYFAARFLFWVYERPWTRLARQSAGVAIGLAAGAAGIWMVDWTVVHTSAEYGYMVIRSL